MNLNFQYITEIFQYSLSPGLSSVKEQNEISALLSSCIETNKRLWDLEDVARMHERGFEAIAKAKMEIDTVNQKRNEIINGIDMVLDWHLSNTELQPPENFQSESPGMLIDRMAILSIRQSLIRRLIAVIEDNELRNEFIKKDEQLSQNIKDLGIFLDSYFTKIRNKEAYFKIYNPLKIYNDDRIKKYIHLLNNHVKPKNDRSD